MCQSKRQTSTPMRFIPTRPCLWFVSCWNTPTRQQPPSIFWLLERKRAAASRGVSLLWSLSWVIPSLLSRPFPRPPSSTPCEPEVWLFSIEQAIGSYLQEQRVNGRSFKTLEWHQTALGLFQHYLVDERHLHLLCQITEAEV